MDSYTTAGTWTRGVRRGRAGVVAALLLVGLAACTPETGGGGSYQTVDQNYMSCSLSEGPYTYRFTPQQDLDVLPRIDGASKGTIVFVHGGGFVEGSRRGNPAPCGSLAYTNIQMGPLLAQRLNGWDIVAIDYRLVTGDPGTKFPGALVDTIEAVKWAQGTGGQWAGINGSKVVVAGHSAGGTIAALMGAYAGTSGALPGIDFPSIAGWMAISAPLDQRDAAAAQNLTTWVNGNVFGYNTNQADPYTAFDRAGRPPGYLIHANDDGIMPVANSVNMASRYPGSITFDRLTTVSADSALGHYPMSTANYTALTSWLSAR